MAYRASTFLQFGGQSLRKLYDVSVDFSEAWEPKFPPFMNEKLAMILHEGRAIKQLYYNSMWLLEYTPNDKKKQ